MERKGEHLFYEIYGKYDLTNHDCWEQNTIYHYVNLHEILVNMTDDEFNRIMKPNNFPPDYKECKECGHNTFGVDNHGGCILVCSNCGHPHNCDELM